LPISFELISRPIFSYMLLADYAEYVKAHERVEQLFKVIKEKEN